MASANGILRNKHRDHDPVWHVQLAMAVAIALQWILPSRYTVGAPYFLPAVELLLILALGITTPKERIFRSFKRRINALLLIAVASVANAYALAGVAGQLLQGTKAASNGKALILAALNIYLTNIIIFGLWYWEMDGGGPGERQRIEKYEYDFLFPQQQNESYQHPAWRPTFVDYMYLSSTNAMAFSPTDTLPLSRRAKMLMLGQATLSLVAVALVAARAVNILH